MGQGASWRYRGDNDGAEPRSQHYNEDGIGLPFHQGVSGFGTRFPTNSVYCAVENRVAEPGDILFSVRAPVGRINLSRERIVIGRGLAAIRSTEGRQAFLYYALRSHFFKEDMIGGGAIFAAITKKDLYGVGLTRPLTQLAKLFTEFVKPIDRQILVLQNTIERLDQSRDLLLPRLMNGEIPVHA